MINAVDRLPAWAFTDTELHNMQLEIVNPNRYELVPKHIAWYHLYKDEEYTGKSMLLLVESVADGWEAVNTMVKEAGLEAQIGWYGDECSHNKYKIEMLYNVLEKWSYVSSVKFVGDDKIFTYEEWMAKLC